MLEVFVFNKSFLFYVNSSVMRILPRHLRDLVDSGDIARVHSTLKGTDLISANVAFIDILRHWPLYGATMYDVTVSMSWGMNVKTITLI